MVVAAILHLQALSIKISLQYQRQNQLLLFQIHLPAPFQTTMALHQQAPLLYRGLVLRECPPFQQIQLNQISLDFPTLQSSMSIMYRYSFGDFNGS